MRIAFFVNSIEGEHPRYTTTALALAVLARGHDVCYVTPGDFVLRPDDSLLVRARVLPGSGYKKVETLYQALQGEAARTETIDIREIDVLMLRNDPAQDAAERPWAASAGPMFGRLAVARGVPGFADVLAAVLSELQVERAVIAQEACGPDGRQPPAWSAALPLAPEQVSHAQFKQLCAGAKAMVRTGECTPYANVLLYAGVAF